jgi:hypothetical protein
VDRYSRNIEFRVQCTLVERLDVFDYVFEPQIACFEPIGSQSIEHEGVVGINTVSQCNFLHPFLSPFSRTLFFRPLPSVPFLRRPLFSHTITRQSGLRKRGYQGAGASDVLAPFAGDISGSVWRRSKV